MGRKLRYFWSEWHDEFSDEPIALPVLGPRTAHGAGEIPAYVEMAATVPQALALRSEEHSQQACLTLAYNETGCRSTVLM